MGRPGAERLGRLPLEQGQSLAVIGHIRLVREVTWHLASQVLHPPECGPVFLAEPHFGAVGAKDDDDHGRRSGSQNSDNWAATNAT